MLDCFEGNPAPEVFIINYNSAKGATLYCDSRSCDYTILFFNLLVLLEQKLNVVLKNAKNLLAFKKRIMLLSIAIRTKLAQINFILILVYPNIATEFQEIKTEYD